MEAKRDDALFTEAFQYPHLMSQALDFVKENNHFSIGPLALFDTLHGHKVILVRREFDRRKLAWLLILMLVISPAAGTLVGRYSHRADVGVAVSASIFALASFLQGLAAWLQI